MRSQIAWLLRGHAHTQAALDEHARAIQELQHRVAELSERVGRGSDDLTDEMRAAVDDLGDRIGALSARLDEAGR